MEEYVFDYQVAEMCHKANKAANALELTKGYIEMILLGTGSVGEFYKGKNPEDVLWIGGVIDIMGWQYDVYLGALHDAEEWLIEDEKIKGRTAKAYVIKDADASLHALYYGKIDRR